MTELELLEAASYCILTENFIHTSIHVAISHNVGWSISMYFEPRKIGIVTDTGYGWHLVVPDIEWFIIDPLTVPTFKYLFMQFVSRITNVHIHVRCWIGPISSRYTLKREFLFSKIIMSKNKRRYDWKIKMAEGELIDVDLVSPHAPLIRLGCFAAAKIAKDPYYDQMLNYACLRRSLHRSSQRPNNSKKVKYHENIPILQKMRKFGTNIVRSYKRWRDRKRI